MKQLTTAKEFIQTNLTDYWQGGKAQYTGEDVEKVMIEFAKLHVKAALENAAENAEAIPYSEGAVGQCGVDEDSILNAYPENNIK